VRDAAHYGAHCYQGHIYSDILFQDGGPSEDCLYLNVFTPASAKGKSKLPVMFWIHRGGYSGGSASEPRHNGDFLPTADLAQEAGGTAGNYGMLDMVAALRWVRGNIARFGGDQENVTIFGESAGSFAVSAL
jgi:para-nitrobenzyl esterase